MYTRNLICPLTPCRSFYTGALVCRRFCQMVRHHPVLEDSAFIWDEQDPSPSRQVLLRCSSQPDETNSACQHICLHLCLPD